MTNAVDLLPANLQNTLNQIVDRVNKANGGINVILLSTAEGVPLGRVYADRSAPLNKDILASIESTWAPASKHFSLLDMGKEAKMVTAIYDHGKDRVAGRFSRMSAVLYLPFFLGLFQPSGTILHVYQAPVVSPRTKF